MTDEEKKVKGYLKDICPICNDREACLQDGCNCYIEQAYLDGLTEGRKDRNCINCSNHSSNLRKENAELNRDKTELVNSVTELKNKVTELEKQIANLEEDKGQIIFESDLKIKALEEMIKKMKCCGNCKHEQDSNTDYYCEDCKRFANETDIEKWESAE